MLNELLRLVEVMLIVDDEYAILLNQVCKVKKKIIGILEYVISSYRIAWDRHELWCLQFAYPNLFFMPFRF